MNQEDFNRRTNENERAPKRFKKDDSSTTISENDRHSECLQQQLYLQRLHQEQYLHQQHLQHQQYLQQLQQIYGSANVNQIQNVPKPSPSNDMNNSDIFEK